MVDHRFDGDASPHTAPADVGAIFHALSDRHRRRILRALEDGPRSVGDLAAPLPISLAAVSKHVQVLERAGLLRKRVAGRRHMCHLEVGPLRAAHDWIARYERLWTGRLDALERRLHEAAAATESNATGGGDPHG
ncbi:metalloregulator ArsR/SmtB family transcription factor [soil metagenome]